MEKLIVYCAVNEGVTKAQNPNVPISAEEIAEDVKRCVDEGVSIVHFHVTDPLTGSNPSPHVQTNVDVYRAVHRKVDVMLYPSAPADFRHVTAAARDPESLAEIGPVIAQPFSPLHMSADVAGQRFNYQGGLASGIQPRESFASAFETCIEQTRLSAEYGLVVSHDVNEPSAMRTIAAFHAMGLYERPVLIKFFMSDSSLYGLPMEPRFLQTYVDLIPPGLDNEWLVFGYPGTHESQLKMYKYAIANGGNVRVGIGDNPSGEGYPATNAERVREVVQLARSMGREIATVSETRERFKAFVQRTFPKPGDPDNRPLVAGYWGGRPYRAPIEG